jgi:LCP family protein required for cell wall assembly
MNVYGVPGGRRRARRSRPRWKRILYWSVSVVLLALLAGLAAGAYWLYGDYSRITSITPDVKSATTNLAPVSSELPVAKRTAIALVIGSDHRYTDGSAPPRSDTLMLVRLDPVHHVISLLSLPRDLWVDIPTVGYNKINAAFGEGKQGPDLALRTVEKYTGVHPQYLVIVNFHGFTSLVNDIRGVYMPVDQNYQHSNAGLPSIDSYSEIHIAPGYQLLQGPDALAFSRYRHTDSDFYRNARQQTFLKAFEQAAANRFHGIGLTDLPAIKDVVDTISGNVEIATHGGSVGLQTLIDYATLAYQLHGRIVSVRLHPTNGFVGAASVALDPPSRRMCGRRCAPS